MDSNSIADELSIAASLGEFQQVKDLLDTGASPAVPDYRGWFAIHWACQEGHLEIASLLIHSGADPNSLTVIEEITPLIQAVGGGHTDVVKLLLQHGADPEVQISFLGGVSPVKLAKKHKFREISAMLGASIENRRAKDSEL